MRRCIGPGGGRECVTIKLTHCGDPYCGCADTPRLPAKLKGMSDRCAACKEARKEFFYDQYHNDRAEWDKHTKRKN